MHRRNVLKSAASAAAGVGLIAAGGDTVRSEERKAGQPSGKPTSPMFVETRDGTSLFIKDWGVGKPVLFITSWALNADMWDYQMTELAGQGLRCVSFDRRGHGRSSQPGHGYDYDTLADDLAAVIERLDLRDLTLIGYSMGGGEIVRYLTRHGSSRVARTVFLGATTPFLLKTADNPEGLEPSAIEGLRAALKEDRPRWFAENAPPFFGQGLPQCSVSPEARQWILDTCQQTPLKALLDANWAVTHTDFRAELRAIKIPTLVIHGDQDKSAPLELTGRKTAGLISGSQLKVYEGAPHALFLTHCERLNGDLLTFIRG